MTSSIWPIMGMVLALNACAADKPIATPAFIQAVQREETASVLRVTTTDIAGDGRTMRIRGTVENIGRERVDGIRYLVLFLSDGQPPRILDTYQREVDTALDPGERKGVALDAESDYNARVGFNPAAIIATPVRLGARPVAPPAEWKE